jgi:YgiT-type zinc finger domain-containing protein
MKCTIEGCSGHYEDQYIVHILKTKNGILAIDNVPAEVCSFCGDTVLSVETVRHIEQIFNRRLTKKKEIQLFEYA